MILISIYHPHLASGFEIEEIILITSRFNCDWTESF